jgi:hypothetical protein
MVQFSLIFLRSNSCVTKAPEAGKAEATGIKEPPSSTISQRMPTVWPRHITARKITRPDTSFRNMRWNTQPWLTSPHKKLTSNMALASATKAKSSRRGANSFFGRLLAQIPGIDNTDFRPDDLREPKPTLSVRGHELEASSMGWDEVFDELFRLRVEPGDVVPVHV